MKNCHQAVAAPAAAAARVAFSVPKILRNVSMYVLLKNSEPFIYLCGVSGVIITFSSLLLLLFWSVVCVYIALSRPTPAGSRSSHAPHGPNTSSVYL